MYQTLFYVEYSHSIHGLTTLPYSNTQDDYPTLAHAMQAAKLTTNAHIYIISSFPDGGHSTTHLYQKDNGDWSTRW